MWAFNVKALIIYLLDLVKPQQNPQLMRRRQRQARNVCLGHFNLGDGILSVIGLYPGHCGVTDYRAN
ncbi:hypothetical protein PS691_03874 [Pseudomonas fluorescens]|uniref:Uncharacterized protein n=1 Tax=Pseudomonas fluorescens TaxID=294 RepID=A0A5E7DXB8_PSEFL|nr:hypothetical protein PS691_03874 [Pseudomonas fluorescens]